MGEACIKTNVTEVEGSEEREKFEGDEPERKESGKYKRDWARNCLGKFQVSEPKKEEPGRKPILRRGAEGRQKIIEGAVAGKKRTRGKRKSRVRASI